MSDQDFGTLPPSAAMSGIEPFKVDIPDKAIEEFKMLLKLSKVAAPTYESSQEDRRYGITDKWLRSAKERWEGGFDWRVCEAKINSFPNYIASIEDDGHRYEVHFAALFSKKPDAVPIVTVHGWPGSFLEFLPLLNEFRKAYSPQSLPYHLIIPSIPGYTFSTGAPTERDFTIQDATRILNQLMINLGFEKSGFIATGGDLGSGVARGLGVHYASCRAVHLNFCIMEPPASVPMESLSAFDQQCLARASEFQKGASAYAYEQGTRPSTIGLVLATNPLALLAWVGEKFLDWTDADPDLDTILEAVSLWWFTETMPRSCYPYRQFFSTVVRKIGHGSPEMYIKKPFGYSLFPKECIPVPVKWVETTGELGWSRVHESGGHFAALEKPGEYKKDIEDFVKHVVEEKGVKFGAAVGGPNKSLESGIRDLKFESKD